MQVSAGPYSSESRSYDNGISGRGVADQNSAKNQVPAGCAMESIRLDEEQVSKTCSAHKRILGASPRLSVLRGVV